MAFTIGIHYGTNSVRTIVVDCFDGREVGSCVVNYPSGRNGVLLDPRDHHVAFTHCGSVLYDAFMLLGFKQIYTPLPQSVPYPGENIFRNGWLSAQN